jgi:hypothetical protein
MPTQQTATINSPNNSSGENGIVSEIQALEERVRLLGESADWWNNKMIWGLVLAAIAAVFVVVTTVMALRRSGQKDDAQSELIRAKDRQLAIDLRDKDGKIADANDRAGAAIERASKADERASQNEKDAAALRKEAEDERLARIKLAEEIAWRTPDRALIPELIPPLQQFGRQRFAFVVDPSEPERNGVVSWIVVLLSSANWSMEPAPASARSELTFGLTNIVLWVSPAAPDTVLQAARTLVPALEQAGLPATVLQSGWGPSPDAAPPQLIRIVVFKKGPRMTITGNRITFEGSMPQIFFGNGPPR